MHNMSLNSQRKQMTSISTLNLLLQVLIIFFFLFGDAKTVSRTKDFYVTKYGAVGNGRKDCSKAFSKAWGDACAWKGNARVIIPKGTYLTGSIAFNGRGCKSKIEFNIRGVVKAPKGPSKSTDYWIRFIYVAGLKITGKGTLDGEGASAWSYKNCKKNRNCHLPISLRLDFLNDTTVEGITLLNSKQYQMNIFACNRVNVNSIKIIAPDESPNTDGIHIGMSNFINIMHSNIGTGDDCISVGQGSNNVYVYDVACGPGHGISIGSLGGSPDDPPVTGLHVKNCSLTGTQNGVRIKTWAQSYPNYVKNVTFEYIRMVDVYNPILIDQEYCPHGKCNRKVASNVQISDVHYNNIWGVSKSRTAVNLICSGTVPCKNIQLKDISLQYYGRDGKISSYCSHAKGVSIGRMAPPSCLK